LLRAGGWPSRQFLRALNNLGVALKNKGDVDARRGVVRPGPERRSGQCLRALQSLRTQDLSRRRSGSGNSWRVWRPGLTVSRRRSRSQIHFALGKALDDTGDYARAFEHTLKANALRRAQLDYDERVLASTTKRIAEVFEAGVFDRLAGEGDPSPVPIFVLGMPRSGSTLIEQILASHPQVQAGGELIGFDKIIQSRPGRRGEPIAYPDYVPEMDGEALRDFARRYLASLPALSDAESHIVDKNTLNFLNVGIIRLALPKAKIVHTLRDPVDTCLSCFVKFFPTGISFTYDLGELGRFYRAYHD